MRSSTDFVWQVALGSLLCAQLGCGETSRARGAPGDGGASPAVAGGGASAGHAPAGATSSGDSGGGGSGGGGGGRAVDRVDIGACRFDDPNVELLARYQILQADEADGSVDGSAGPGDVKRLDVTQEVGALGGIECLENLEELSLSIYGPDAPPVGLSALAGLSKLRKLSLAGPFVLDGLFGGLALERLQLSRLPLANLQEVGKEEGLRDLRLVQVPITSLAGIETLRALSSLHIEKNGRLSNLTPLERLSGLEELELQGLPALTSLFGLEPHTGLRSLFTSEVPLSSLVPLAAAEQLESLNVGTSRLLDLQGLEDKPALTNVTVTDASLTELSPLTDLPRLSYVSLARNRIEDLTPLTSCPALSHLDVSKNAVASLAPVAAMRSLQTLEASGNALTTIDAQLPASLKVLLLAGNGLSSLEPLRAHALETVDVSGNPLTSLEPLFDLPALRGLYADDVGAGSLEEFPLARLGSLSAKNNQITSVAPLSGLGELSVDLTGNAVAQLPGEFVGPAAACGGLVLLDNPLDAAAQARLTWLCANASGSYQWDGGACDKCPII
jgi:Leucine-rich repeat (LRR) protein